MAEKRELKVVDISHLDDGDWTAINRVKRIYESGDFDAFWAEIEKMDGDPVHRIKALFA
jgi:hypothetical protein